MSKKWRKLSEKVRKIGYRTLVFKEFVIPDGSRKEFTTYSKIGSRDVAVIALTKDKQVIIARQFRPGPEKVMDELPGGDAEPGETDEAVAKRELLEETGYVIGGIEYLGPAYRDAYSNAQVHYFIAYDCTQESQQRLDIGEFIEAITITIPDLLENARQGNMTDAAAVLLAYEKLQEI